MSAALALAFFAGALIVTTWPAVPNMASHWVVDGRVPEQLKIEYADTLLNAWILHWTAHHFVGRPTALFQTNAFFPAPMTLALSEHMLGNVPLYLAGLAISGNPVFAYNFYVFGTFLAAACGAFFLMRLLGYGWWESVLAGLVFAYCPVRMARMMDGETQLLGLYWLPWVLSFLLRYYRHGWATDALLFGVTLAMQMLASFYLAYYALIALALVGAALLIGYGATITWWRHAGAALAAACAAAVFLVYTTPYQQLRAQGVLREHSSSEAVNLLRMNSADAARSYTTCLPFGGGNIYRDSLRCPGVAGPQRRAFAGFVALGLFALGVLTIWKWRPPGCDATVVGSLAALVVVAYVLSLGPHLVWNGRPVRTSGGGLVHLPYELFAAWIPGFSSMRSPARFSLLTMLGVAFFAGNALYVIRRVSRSVGAGHLLGLAVVALVCVEYSFAPVRLVEAETRENVSPMYETVRTIGGAAAVAELPIGNGMWDRAPLYQYRSIFHGHPLVNGYSGHFPPGHWQRMGALADLPAQASIDALRSLGVQLIIVHGGDPLLEERHRPSAMTAAGLEIVAEHGADVLYRLPR